jgi:transcription elongation factor Elf1
MIKHKVDVSRLESYNWDCPRCEGFNKEDLGPNLQNILFCKDCGTEIKFDIRDGWTWEEV